MTAISGTQLAELFAATLDANPGIRTQAEAHLKAIKCQPGLCPIILQLLATADAHPAQLGILQAAAVFLKNTIELAWDADYESSKEAALSGEDKALVRGHIIRVLAGADRMIQKQLFAALPTIISADFPENWPTVLEEVGKLIHSSQPAQVVVGLKVFVALVARHGSGSLQWRESLFEQVFPVIKALVDVHIGLIECPESCEIVKCAFKAFYNAVQFKFSGALLGGNSFASWAHSLINALRQSPPDGLEDDWDASFWKRQKWAMRVLNKVNGRYGNSSSGSFHNHDQPEFAEGFMAQAALPILEVMLGLLFAKDHISPQMTILACEHLSAALRHKTTWSALKGHMPRLMQDILFPVLCFGDEDEAVWESDPIAYIKTRLDPFDDWCSSVAAVQCLLVDAVRVRRRTVLPMVLSLMQTVLQQCGNHPSQIDLARRKDGALNLLGIMSTQLTLQRSGVRNQLEDVMRAYVLPELGNFRHGWLLVRACWTLEQYDELDWSEPTLIAALQAIMACLGSGQMAIQAQALQVIPTFIEYEGGRKVLLPCISQVLQLTMDLTDRTDLEGLPYVMEQLVASFSPELAPFALQVASQLGHSLVRLITLSVAEDDDEEGLAHTMTANGIIRSLLTLVEAMEETPAVMEQLESVLVPLLHHLLTQPGGEDYFQESLQIVDGILFTRKMVSVGMWSLLGPILDIVTSQGLDYVTDMSPAIENYLAYGGDAFWNDRQKIQAIVGFIQDAAKEEPVCSFQLAEATLLYGSGRMDEYLVVYLDMVLQLVSDDSRGFSSVVHALDVFLAALYYNARMTLEVLSGRVDVLLGKTLVLHERMNRVHEKQLIILGLGSLLMVGRVGTVTVTGAQMVSMVRMVLQALVTLPDALKERARLLAEADGESADEYDGYEDDSDYDSLDSDHEEPPGKPGAKQGEKGGLALDEEDEDDDDLFEEDGGEELEEELGLESPMDRIDVNLVAGQLFKSLHASHPDVLMIEGLTASQRALLSTLIHQ